MEQQESWIWKVNSGNLEVVIAVQLPENKKLSVDNDLSNYPRVLKRLNLSYHYINITSCFMQHELWSSEHVEVSRKYSEEANFQPHLIYDKLIQEPISKIIILYY